jgi:hypothetical protein
MRSTFYFLVLLFVSQQISAQTDQPRFFIGLTAGYNTNYHTGKFFLPNPKGDQPFYTTGNGNDIVLGFAGEYRLDDAGSTSLQCKLYYERKPGSFTADPLPYSNKNNSEVLLSGATLQATYDLFNLEILYEYDIPFMPNFGISIGPKLGYALNKNIIQNGLVWDVTNSPDTILVADTLNSSGSIVGASTFRLGVKLSVQYKIILGRFLITPALWYDYGITKIIPGWQVNTLAGTVDVIYGL